MQTTTDPSKPSNGNGNEQPAEVNGDDERDPETTKTGMTDTGHRPATERSAEALMRELLALQKDNASSASGSSSFEKVALILSCVGVSVVLVASVAARLAPWHGWKWLGLGMGLLALLAVAACALREVVSAVQTMRDPSKPLLARWAKRLSREVDGSLRLANEFDQHLLDYAHQTLTLEGEQLVERVGWLVGSFSKVGLVSSCVLGFFFAREIWNKADLPRIWISGGLVAVIGLNLVGLRFVMMRQRLGQAALLLQSAAAKKRETAHGEGYSAPTATP